jgi:predicted metalloprotease
MSRLGFPGTCARIVSLIGAVLIVLPQLLPSAAVAQTPPQTPAIQGYRGSGDIAPYQGDFASLANEIDAFWAEIFFAAGVPYESPDIFVVEGFTFTACGPVEPIPNAFYCPGDRTIYLVPQFLIDQELQFGDFAPIAVFSHEWGHHVQALLSIIGFGPPTKTSELQADCLMGAFTRHADERALLDYGDFLEALNTAIDAGDESPLPEDAPGAHGLPEERVKALTKGYGGGPITGCDLLHETGPTVPPTTPPLILTPTPTPSITSYLPLALPLTHAGCFRIEEDRNLTFDEIAGRLGGTADARMRLQEWGWQASAGRTFACDGPPYGAAGWVDIGVHLFSSPASAQQAVDYYAALRAEGTNLTNAAPPFVGDYSAALAGPTTNGTEFTLYASRGPLLIRVTGVSPTVSPFANVEAVTQSILTTGASPSMPETFPLISTFLPQTLPLDHAACFETRADQILTFDEISRRFANAGDASTRLRGWGWQTGAYREFTCDAPPEGEAGWIDVSVHRFADAMSAQQALDYFADARVSAMNIGRTSAPDVGDLATAVTGPTTNGNEFTLYVSSDSLLLRVTGVSASGIPFGNVMDVVQELLTSIER